MKKPQVAKVVNAYAVRKIKSGVPPEAVIEELKIDLKAAPEVREAFIIYELKNNENKISPYLTNELPEEHENSKEEAIILKKFGVTKEKLREILENDINEKLKRKKSLQEIGTYFGFVANEQGNFVYNKQEAQNQKWVNIKENAQQKVNIQQKVNGFVKERKMEKDYSIMH